eukprot:TRINITY_DN8455_c0_g5_i1.p1 TRINITY_DN8455_c0_g5~~TRINITY_DN8455_c0_g5_i1.p1  ORF type:complete len:374 (+),score=18.22 TRINITY_DN8455_c0_g5_i1:76-1197(+)
MATASDAPSASPVWAAPLAVGNCAGMVGEAFGRHSTATDFFAARPPHIHYAPASMRPAAALQNVPTYRIRAGRGACEMAVVKATVRLPHRASVVTSLLSASSAKPAAHTTRRKAEGGANWRDGQMTPCQTLPRYAAAAAAAPGRLFAGSSASRSPSPSPIPVFAHEAAASSHLITHARTCTSTPRVSFSVTRPAANNVAETPVDTLPTTRMASASVATARSPAVTRGYPPEHPPLVSPSFDMFPMRRSMPISFVACASPSHSIASLAEMNAFANFRTKSTPRARSHSMPPGVRSVTPAIGHAFALPVYSAVCNAGHREHVSGSCMAAMDPAAPTYVPFPISNEEAGLQTYVPFPTLTAREPGDGSRTNSFRLD